MTCPSSQPGRLCSQNAVWPQTGMRYGTGCASGLAPNSKPRAATTEGDCRQTCEEMNLNCIDPNTPSSPTPPPTISPLSPSSKECVCDWLRTKKTSPRDGYTNKCSPNSFGEQGLPGCCWKNYSDLFEKSDCKSMLRCSDWSPGCRATQENKNMKADFQAGNCGWANCADR